MPANRRWQTAIRETAEETGLRFAPGELLELGPLQLPPGQGPAPVCRAARALRCERDAIAAATSPTVGPAPAGDGRLRVDRLRARASALRAPHGGAADADAVAAAGAAGLGSAGPAARAHGARARRAASATPRQAARWPAARAALPGAVVGPAHDVQRAGAPAQAVDAGVGNGAVARAVQRRPCTVRHSMSSTPPWVTSISVCRHASCASARTASTTRAWKWRVLSPSGKA